MQFPFHLRQRTQSPVAKAELLLADEFAAAPLDLSARRSVTGLIVDDLSAKVLDDAIFARVNQQGYEIVVSVADVAAVVPHRSLTDRIARARGVDHSKDDRKIPMLHKSLVESRLSLADKRATLSAVIQLDVNFDLTDVKFEQSVLGKPVRSNYATFGAETSDEFITYSWIAENLRRNRGVSELESPSDYARGHQVVNEFMNLANSALTQFAEVHDVPLLYLNNNDGKSSLSGHDWGHEAQSGSYAQFTSPIRRFSDLVNTRQLSAYVRGAELPYDVAELSAIGIELTALQSPEFKRGPYPADIQRAAEVIDHITPPVEDHVVIREVEKSLKSSEPHQNALLHALFANDHPLSARFSRLALQHMFHQPHLALAALNSARQTGYAGEPVFESVSGDNDGFHESVTVEISGVEQRGEGIAPNKKLARQLAVTTAFAQHVDQQAIEANGIGDELGL